MSLRFRVLLGAGMLAMAVAPAAEARVATEAAVSGRPAKFKLTRLNAPPASVQAGRSFRISGRVANRRGRRAGTGRVTFSLRRAGRGSHRFRVRTRRARLDRNEGQNIRLTRGGRSRRFTVRLLVPRYVAAGRYTLRA